MLHLLLTVIFGAALFAGQGAPAGSKEAFLKVCANCHPPEVASAGRRTRTQWEDVVEKMIVKGAKGTDEQFLLVLDYLMAEHGRVNVNNATVNEMSEILGISGEQAEAIVKHRRAKGKFEDFEALSKVPGVDLKKLEEKRGAISF
jgi:competence protein ComEA